MCTIIKATGYPASRSGIPKSDCGSRKSAVDLTSELTVDPASRSSMSQDFSRSSNWSCDPVSDVKIPKDEKDPEVMIPEGENRPVTREIP